MAAALLLAFPTLAAHASEPTQLDLKADASDRMTVPVLVNDRGPFAFIVDSAADRTVVSNRLAAQLALPSGGMARLQSLAGVSDVNTVLIDSIRVSTRETTNVIAPSLREEHLGASGLLGIDSLKDQRIILDFVQKRMTIEPGDKKAEEPPLAEDQDVIVVRARRKYGQLVVTDAEANGVPIRVVIDTGAQNSIGNSALRRQMARVGGSGRPQPITLLSVTGETLPANYSQLPTLKIGGLSLAEVPVAYADADSFRRFGLARKPALLLGMDVLAVMDRVTIDFANRSIRFVLREQR